MTTTVSQPCTTQIKKGNEFSPEQTFIQEPASADDVLQDEGNK